MCSEIRFFYKCFFKCLPLWALFGPNFTKNAEYFRLEAAERKLDLWGGGYGYLPRVGLNPLAGDGWFLSSSPGGGWVGGDTPRPLTLTQHRTLGGGVASFVQRAQELGGRAMPHCGNQTPAPCPDTHILWGRGYYWRSSEKCRKFDVGNQTCSFSDRLMDKHQPF